MCLLRFYLRGFIGAGARAEWSAGLGGWAKCGADHKGSDSGLQNFHNLRINEGYGSLLTTNQTFVPN